MTPSEKRVGEIEARLKAATPGGRDILLTGGTVGDYELYEHVHGDIAFLLTALKASREVVEAARGIKWHSSADTFAELHAALARYDAENGEKGIAENGK